MTEETKPTRGKSKKTLEREKESLLSEMRRAFSLGRNKDRDNRTKALNDLQMLDGEDHWDYTLQAVKERKDDGRPCLTINLLPKFCDQVEGDQRMNRPASRSTTGTPFERCSMKSKADKARRQTSMASTNGASSESMNWNSQVCGIAISPSEP